MDTKNKIYVALLLSVVVYAGGGYYLINLVDKKQYLGMSDIADFYINNSNSEYTVKPKYFENLLKLNSKRKRVNLNQERTAYEQILPSSSMESPIQSKMKQSNDYPIVKNNSNRISNNYSYDNRLLSDNMIFGTPIAIENEYSYNSGRKNNESEQSGLYNSGKYFGPLAVPFSNYTGTPTTTGGTILFDPGVETESLESTTIPVGEGGWLLVLLAVGYAGWRRWRN